jgi:hypothetical protein
VLVIVMLIHITMSQILMNSLAHELYEHLYTQVGHAMIKEY